MAVRKKAKAATRKTSFNRATKKNTKPEVASGGFSDYFRISESYTSLILGIVVVIIAAVLLISFIRGREFKTPSPAPEISSTKIEPELTREPAVSGEENQISPTIMPVVSPVPTVTPVQNMKGTYTVKAGDDLWHIAETTYHDGYKWKLIADANKITNPGMIFSGNVLKIPAVTSQPVIQSTTPAQNQQVTSQPAIVGNTYKIKHGDTLWSIAERRYKNGYRWVDIAKSNNLSDPNLIHAENDLQLPQ